MTDTNDPANSLAHCEDSDIERINNTINAYFLKEKVMEHIWLYERKINPIENLKKARWYLDQLIDIYE